MPVTTTVTLVTFVWAMSNVGMNGSEKVERKLKSIAVNSKTAIDMETALVRDIANVESRLRRRKKKGKKGLKHITGDF